MKRFDVDNGKARLRARWREFVRTRVYDRKNAHVLCFPGEHGFEIEQVYRKLGFRDCNIFGVERDPKAAKAIREKYPDIILFEGEMAEFCRQYDGPPFAVVSLDYCGSLGTDKLTPLTLLAAQHLLTDRSVFLVNVMAGRETSETQHNLRSFFAAEQQRKLAGQQFTKEELTDSLRGIISTAKDRPLGEVRSDALTAGVIQVTAVTVPTFEATTLLDLTHVRGSRVLLDIDTEVHMTEDGVSFDNARLGSTNDRVATAGHIKHEAIQDINADLKQMGVFNPALHTAEMLEVVEYHVGRTLVMAFYDRCSYPYMTTSIERYSYISNTGKRMVCDMFEFRTFREELERIPLAVAPFNHPDNREEHRFFLHPRPEETHKTVNAYFDWLMQNVVKPYARICEKVKQHQSTWPERIDLGGNVQEFDEEKAKAKAIALLKKGREIPEVSEKTHLSPGTLRALKAHITMGTY